MQIQKRINQNMKQIDEDCLQLYKVFLDFTIFLKQASQQQSASNAWHRFMKFTTKFYHNMPQKYDLLGSQEKVLLYE